MERYKGVIWRVVVAVGKIHVMVDEALFAARKFNLQAWKKNMVRLLQYHKRIDGDGDSNGHHNL